MNQEQFKQLIELARDAGDGALWIVLIVYLRYYVSMILWAIIVPVVCLIVRSVVKYIVDCCSASQQLLPENVYYWTYSAQAKAKTILDKHWDEEEDADE